ncbi:MAG: RNase adapter RapZ [Candidatus Protistobacter heckmanni]|nr:RNase adapter RapZ [Candidatus Protistobacter heckmanni]
MRIVLISGSSGAGKSGALNVLEDAGYYCVDNLPTPLLENLVGTLEAEGKDKLAVAIDARSLGSIVGLTGIIAALKTQHDVRPLFLTADINTLVQRYSETRRRHPLSAKLAGSGQAGADTASLTEAIELEREMLEPLSGLGHQIDTSNLAASSLRAWVKDFITHEPSGLTLLFESFGFKRGVPHDADLVFDVRPLPNPHYIAELKPLTGLDQPVRDFLLSQPAVLAMADDIRAFVEKWLPSYVEDNRSYLTVAIGCTGGQHRSVFIAERLAAYFAAHCSVMVRHRDIPI